MTCKTFCCVGDGCFYVKGESNSCIRQHEYCKKHYDLIKHYQGHEKPSSIKELLK